MSPPSVADLARATLLALAERQLPATPENYARVYAEMAGKPATASQQPLSHASSNIVAMVRQLVDRIIHRTASLSEELQARNADIRGTVDELGSAEEKELILRLAQAITEKADLIHLSVVQTQNELAATRSTLERMGCELSETRQSLLEDALTGAQNRRGMDALLMREVARVRRHGGRLTVAMIDIDHFKEVNDRFGHDAGDALLAHIGMVARSVLRESDALVRYGGEEFLLILPDADIQGAGFVVDRLREMIARSPLLYDQHPIAITFSCGIACLAEGENGHSLVLRADRALYDAKRAGRNCTHIAN
ncbi:GGDEF domain-containing protein [Thiobacter aerophilum]|uniref:diguanylate cyclase n=1 Tax=Thiobacter aerophilum TaxID=3121275 RepID=A0ABV0EEE5_9BURK